MKTRPTTVSVDGVFKLSGSYDGVGVMARTPRDLVLLTEAISTPESGLQIPFDVLASKFRGDWSDIAVGMVQSTWGVPQTSTLAVPPKAKWEVPYMKQSVLAPAVVFRICHERWALTFFIAHPTQTQLIKSRDDKMTPEVHDQSAKELHRLALDTIEKVMEEHDLDVIVANSDSTLVAYAACARWPIATIPLGNLEDSGQPFGQFFLGRVEDVLLKFMLLYERTFPAIARPEGHSVIQL